MYCHVLNLMSADVPSISNMVTVRNNELKSDKFNVNKTQNLSNTFSQEKLIIISIIFKTASNKKKLT
jgi:hypothetical protein